MGRSGEDTPEIILDHHKTGVEVKGSLVPEYINDFFSNIGGELFSTLRDIPQVSTSKEPTKSSYGVTPDSAVTYKEVLDLVKAIEVHKSSGIDDIQTTVLKDAFLILAPQLTSLINLSLHNIRFPREWAAAKVVPLPKSGNIRHIGQLETDISITSPK